MYLRKKEVGEFNLTEIVVAPLLHLNQIKFIGHDSSTNKQLAFKTLGDSFISLNDKGELSTWSIMTGKFLYKTNLKLSWASEYGSPIFIGRDQYKQKFLLRSKTKIEDYDQGDYFQKHQYEKYIEEQRKGYLEIDGFSMHKMKIIEITDEYNVNELVDFTLPYFGQKNYFNDDISLMIASICETTYLYKRENQGDNHNIKWILVKRLEKFQRDLMSGQFGFFPFVSPSFQHYIQVNHRDKKFIIKELISEKLIAEVPTNLMTFEKSDWPLIKEVINRIYWIDDSFIKIVNEEGIEKIVNYINNFDEVASNHIPMLSTKPYDVQSKLCQQHQKYSSLLYLEHLQNKNQIYSLLYSLHPSQTGYTELSFTYFHWSIAEQLMKNKINLDQLPESILQLMLLNIFPGGNTFLHKMVKDNQVDDIAFVFDKSQPNKTELADIKIYVPIIKNMQKQSPLHIANDKQDNKTLGIFLQYLAGYGLAHHSHAIKDLIPTLIKKQLPQIIPYLVSTLKQTKQLAKIDRAKIKDNQVIIVEPLWLSESQFINAISSEKGFEKRITCNYIDIPDIYHYLDNDFKAFMEALANTTQIDIFTKATIINLLVPHAILQIIQMTYFYYFFDSKQRQINVELNHLSQTTQYEITAFFLLSIALISTYFLVNEARQMFRTGINYFKEPWNYIDLITPCGFYFLILAQITDYQNEQVMCVVKTIVVFFMWIKFLYFFRMFEKTGVLIRLILTVMNDMKHFLLVLLFSILAFSDSFLNLSHFNEDEEQQFVGSFGDSFLYTYQIVLSGLNLEQTGKVNVGFVLLLQILCTLFGLIVLLNLLIAIISETFEKVSGYSAKATYQEKAALIHENSFLIPYKIKQLYAKQNKFLLLVEELDSTDEKNDHNQYLYHFKNIHKSIKNISAKNTLLEQQAIDQKQFMNGMVTQMSDFQQQVTDLKAQNVTILQNLAYVVQLLAPQTKPQEGQETQKE
eukprot:403373706